MDINNLSSPNTPSSNSPNFSTSFFLPNNYTLPSSLSLTPSTLSDDEAHERGGSYQDSDTMHRLGEAQLALECELELRNHLHEINNEICALRRENALLRSANTDLVKVLNNYMFNLSYVNPFVVGDDVFDEGLDISPTSVINSDRFTYIPKSISALSSSSSSSSGYRNYPPPLMHEGVASNRVPNHDQEGSSRNGGAMMQVKTKSNNKYNQGMVKTELCNKWKQSGGACPYGDICQFAHGVRELRPVSRHPRYKTQVCRMIIAGNTCPYGHRCHFRHSLNDQSHI